MPARLTIFPALEPPSRSLVFEERAYELGRDAGCDIVVDDDRISRRHARLEFRGDAWHLIDLGSKNGIAVEGLAASSAVLRPGCWLSLGGVIGQFDRLESWEARGEVESRARRWSISAAHQRRLDPRLDLDSLLRRVLGSVLELSGAERGFVLLEGREGLAVAAATGLGDDDLRRPEFGGSVGAVSRALDLGRAVAVADLADHASLAGRASVRAGGIRALVCVPLAALGRRLGALYADSTQPGVCFDEHDVELLEAFAEHAALAIALARLEGEVERLSADLPLVSDHGGEPPVIGNVPEAVEIAVTRWQDVVGAHAERRP